jgi:hypothetical protein
VTAPTGGLSLTQAGWHDKNRVIDQTIYFRFDLFGNFIWKQARPAYNVEITEATFCVKIAGKDIGKYPLTLRYNPKWEAGQNNYTTILSWGALSNIITNSSLVGKYISIYDPPASKNEPFYLEIA